MEIIKAGDRVRINNEFYGNPTGTVIYVANVNELYPVGVKLDKPDGDGYWYTRCSFKEAIKIGGV